VPVGQGKGNATRYLLFLLILTKVAPSRRPTLNQRLILFHRKFKRSIAFTAASSDEKSASS
jgi:hypothetical protein